MGAPPRPDVPASCTAVSLECPVEGTLYGYYPSLGWNAFFAAFFGLCFIAQVGLGIRYKTWTYMIGVGLGCLAECVGYIGRIMMNDNPYSDSGFQLQIVLLIFAPAFLAAGIYLVLKHAVLQFGEEWSRVRPAWYTYIFIACDISSLVLQSAGGGIAATADDDPDLSDIGTNIMIAGIIWQVVILAVFGVLVTEYVVRTYRRRDRLSPRALNLWASRRFRCFIAAVFLAYLTIFIRCVYRIPELLGGWGNELMRIESEFIALEGIMIVLCVLAQTVCHPGIFFPVMGRDQAREQAKLANEASESGETEMRNPE